MSLCPECGNIVKTVPAGVSKKTGKPYGSFQVCSSQECGWKPPRESGFTPAQQAAPAHKAEGKSCSSPEMMRLSYRKDLMIEIIKAFNAITDNQGIKDMFNDYWSEIEK